MRMNVQLFSVQTHLTHSAYGITKQRCQMNIVLANCTL